MIVQATKKLLEFFRSLCCEKPEGSRRKSSFSTPATGNLQNEPLDEESTISELRLMVVGFENVGKTTLLRAMSASKISSSEHHLQYSAAPGSKRRRLVSWLFARMGTSVDEEGSQVSQVVLFVICVATYSVSGIPSKSKLHPLRRSPLCRRMVWTSTPSPFSLRPTILSHCHTH